MNITTPQNESHDHDKGVSRGLSIQPVEVLAFGLIAVLLLAGAGCGFTGESGNLRFFYDTAELSPQRPIAVGATAQLNVYENVGERDSRENPVEVTNVTSSNSDVLKVTNVASPDVHSFRLEAGSTGSAEISVEGETENGEQISDTLTISSEEATSVDLQHVCESDSDDPVYLTDQNHVVRMKLESSDGDTLAGWGYNPVEVNGPDEDYAVATSVEQSDELGVAFGTQPGTVTINSTIDDASVTLEAVSEADVDSMSWFGSEDDTPALFEGRIYAKFSVGGREACNARVDLSVSVQTPDVCSVSTEFLPADANLLTEIGETQTSLSVSEQSEDVCRFDVEVAQASTQVSKSVELDLAGDE